MTTEQKQLVRLSWMCLAPHRLLAARLLLDHLAAAGALVDAHAEAHADAGAAATPRGAAALERRVARLLDHGVAALDDPARLRPLARLYGARGPREGPAERPAAIGVALVAMLRALLGPASTPTLEAAWLRAHAEQGAVLRRAAGTTALAA